MQYHPPPRRRYLPPIIQLLTFRPAQILHIPRIAGHVVPVDVLRVRHVVADGDCGFVGAGDARAEGRAGLQVGLPFAARLRDDRVHALREAVVVGESAGGEVAVDVDVAEFGRAGRGEEGEAESQD